MVCNMYNVFKSLHIIHYIMTFIVMATQAFHQYVWLTYEMVLVKFKHYSISTHLTKINGILSDPRINIQ